jgi:hypothetical protein
MKKIIFFTLVIFLVPSLGLSQPPQIYSPDGKYLGNLSDNPYDPNSVSNPYGRYGSPYSPDSINNPYGRYGSPYSPESPNNPYAIGRPGHERRLGYDHDDD